MKLDLSELVIPELNKNLRKQLQRLLSLGYHKAAGMTRQEFINLIWPLRNDFIAWNRKTTYLSYNWSELQYKLDRTYGGVLDNSNKKELIFSGPEDTIHKLICRGLIINKNYCGDFEIAPGPFLLVIPNLLVSVIMQMRLIGGDYARDLSGLKFENSLEPCLYFGPKHNTSCCEMIAAITQYPEALRFYCQYEWHSAAMEIRGDLGTMVKISIKNGKPFLSKTKRLIGAMY